jgi:HlyD family secretion protein
MFGGPPEQPKNADVARGARQQLWVVGADGKAKPMPVTVGHTNGTVTEVSGPGLRPGLKVITGQLTGAGK